MTPLQRILIVSTLLAPLVSAPQQSLTAPDNRVDAAARRVETVYKISQGVRDRIRGSRTVDVPPTIRQGNWGPSCVHASMVYLLQWQGRYDLAAKWRSTYRGGETMPGLSAKLEANGIDYRSTANGDEAFLEWATTTRRGAGVVVEQGAHMIDVVGMTPQIVQIWDSNSPASIQTRDRQDFLREWREAGGWGFTPLAGPPAAPRPWLVSEQNGGSR